MVSGPKHCSKLNDSTFTISIDPCEDTSGLKSLPEWYAKPQDLFLDSIFNIFEKNNTLITDVFLKLRTPKNLVRKMSKKSRFTEPFDK